MASRSDTRAESSTTAGPAAVAAGHPATADAARQVLAAGGNAFDAAIAAHFAACVAEPLLISLAGGGFLLARTASGDHQLFDFFARTPLEPRAGEADLYPIEGDFGEATQTFHIGMGSIAVPGTIKGLFRIHRELASLPMAELAAPAIALARDGVEINAMQASTRRILRAIVDSTAESKRLFGAIAEGARFRFPDHADVLEALAREGQALFYRGELGRELVAACERGGGHLTVEDLRRYRVVRREPLAWSYRDVRLWSNPPPAVGGLLVAFALELAAAMPAAERFGSPTHLERLLRDMASTDRAAAELARIATAERAPRRAHYLERYRRVLREHLSSFGGTTHVSIVDRHGNLASLSMTNGEGSGYILPGTGIMLNNMLGEAEIQLRGLGDWPRGRRLASMMAPTVAEHPDGRLVALGSGGSSRIRTAILQVLVGLFDLGLPLEDAVGLPRLHLERGKLDVEPGFPEASVHAVAARVDEHKIWPHRSMFFGGVHAVELDPATGTCYAAGDPRRQGAGVVID